MEITAKDIYFICPVKDLKEYMVLGDNCKETYALRESETTQDVYDVLSKFSGSKLASFFSNDSLMTGRDVELPKFTIRSMRVVNPVSEESEILEGIANVYAEEDCFFEINVSYGEYPDYLSFLEKIGTQGWQPVDIGPADFASPDHYIREIQQVKKIISSEPAIVEDPSRAYGLVQDCQDPSESLSPDYLLERGGISNEKTAEILSIYSRTYFGRVMLSAAADCVSHGTNVTKQIVNTYTDELLESLYPLEEMSMFVI